MAQNFHNNLPNNQLHNPKDFSVSESRSVVTKSESSTLKWVNANYASSTTVKCFADTSKRLAGSFFYLYSTNNATSYQVWFDVDSDPGTFQNSIAGHTLVEVSIHEDETANNVATALKNAVDALGDFTATVSTDTVTITGKSSCNDCKDGNTGFTIITTRTATPNEVLVTDSTGVIGWHTSESLGHGKETLTWRGSYHLRSSSDLNDYHTFANTPGTMTFQHDTNLGTGPTNILPSVANYAAILNPLSSIKITKMRLLIEGTQPSGEDITFGLMVATPASGTGPWDLTPLPNCTTGSSGLAIKAGEVADKWLTGLSDCVVAGELVIPVIKTDMVSTGKGVRYTATIEYVYDNTCASARSSGSKKSGK